MELVRWTQLKRWFMCCKANCEGVYSHFNFAIYVPQNPTAHTSAKRAPSLRSSTHSTTTEREWQIDNSQANFTFGKIVRFVFVVKSISYRSDMRDTKKCAEMNTNRSVCVCVCEVCPFYCVYVHLTCVYEMPYEWNSREGQSDRDGDVYDKVSVR